MFSLSRSEPFSDRKEGLDRHPLPFSAPVLISAARPAGKRCMLLMPGGSAAAMGRVYCGSLRTCVADRQQRNRGDRPGRKRLARRRAWPATLALRAGRRGSNITAQCSPAHRAAILECRVAPATPAAVYPLRLEGGGGISGNSHRACQTHKIRLATKQLG